ncbi:RecX family transcriptional regulator [Desulfosporosinus sp. PR]|uniref:regulatory protein RecX n=1 Tax=Candidatus Desulfosporosinus nitrosoreducens TaxID=3401928 RepID=UPI0027ED9F56|nr:RecX family transcriptional regulator [Desulfosporosinus sp. PR]MDQ7096081.1 RecX family transcriptional regulator [Desulfosporosinus sp. PR]
MIRLTSHKPRKSAWETALDCLSRRALTTHELEARLSDKGFAGEEIGEAVAKLVDYGYLNDRELALSYVKSRLKRYSRRRVILDMQNRGIASRLIEEVLEEAYSQAEEFQQCLFLARKWWAQEEQHRQEKASKDLKGQLIPAELLVQQKVVRKLIQRGYPSDMVRGVVSEIQSPRNDETIDF